MVSWDAAQNTVKNIREGLEESSLAKRPGSGHSGKIGKSLS